MAKKRYPRSESLLYGIDGPAYVSYNENETDKAVGALNSAINGYSGMSLANHRMGFDPRDIGGTDISGRYGLTHQGYEAFRPDQATRFSNPKESMLHADRCYRNHGLIKNVIDLMGDFASQGIRIVHPNPRIQKFFQNWWRRVRGVERSERFLNQFYRLGNVVVRRQNAKISPRFKEKLYKARAAVDMEVKDLQIEKNVIPMKYTFLHPVTIELLGGPLANFSGKPEYAIKLPRNLARIIKSPKNDSERKLVAELPDEIRKAAETSKPIILPSDRTRVFHYKKDDWQEWAYPMISAISLDISLYEQLKLADRAALDGAISNIRIIKLGSLEHKIVPTEAAAAKLASILESNVHAGTIDLIWGPDIEMLESNTNVHQFLGQGKYEPTLIAIYAGLGIPPTLTGTFGAGGTTNNFISLKTLTQRLEYGRDVLVQFWDEEIRIVQEAMGFRFPARIEFDLMNLGDESSDKALLIQLADRNLISDELIQRYFGSDPEMERIRTNHENKQRERGLRVSKAGAFHEPEQEFGLKKVFAQTGAVTPSEVGLELEKKKKGEKSALELRSAQTGVKGPAPKKKGVPQQGRPKNSKDSTKRQTKTFKPKTKAVLSVWARDAQEQIAELVNPVLLEKFDKKNMRSLSSEQMEDAEKIKFGILCNLEPCCTVTPDSVHTALNNKTPDIAISMYDTYAKQTIASLDRQLTINERKNIQAYVYAELNGEDNG